MVKILIVVGWILSSILWGYAVKYLLWLLNKGQIKEKNLRPKTHIPEPGLRKRPLTYVLGFIEVMTTSAITLYMIKSNLSPEQILTIGGAFIGGWFVIKVLPHPVNKDEKNNTGLNDSEIRHKFIVGTVLSLAGGIGIGFLLSLIV